MKEVCTLDRCGTPFEPRGDHLEAVLGASGQPFGANPHNLVLA